MPVEYYNKLPKRVTVQTAFVLDPCPPSAAHSIPLRAAPGSTSSTREQVPALGRDRHRRHRHPQGVGIDGRLQAPRQVCLHRRLAAGGPTPPPQPRPLRPTPHGTLLGPPSSPPPQAVDNISSAHPDVPIHVGLIDRLHDPDGAPLAPILPGLGDIGDRLFGTDGNDDFDEDGLDGA